MAREHPEHHIQKPTFVNQISTGSWITIGGGVLALAVMWGAIQTTQAQQAAEIKAVEDRSKERIEVARQEVSNMRQDMQRLEGKIDRLLMEVRDNRSRQ